MKKVSLKRIIGNVVGDMGISNVNNHIDDFARWAFDAQYKIGSKLSFRHIECEIDVKNNRAPLPEGIVKLNRLKVGNQHIEITNKDFIEFYKGLEDPAKIIEEVELKNEWKEQCEIVGVHLVIRILFSGLYVPQEVVTITFAYSNCGTVSTNTFTYIVQVGDDTPAIIQAFADQINAVHGIGFKAVIGDGFLSIEADNPDINITPTTYTDSILGKISHIVFQKRIPSGKTEGNEAHEINSPRKGSENLANRKSAVLNTGLTRESAYSIWNDQQGHPVTKFAISNSCIHITNGGIEKIGISYEGMAVDCDGWPEIEEIHETATTQYLIFKYLQKRFWGGKVNNFVYQEAKMEWFRLCSQARGDAELPNTAEMEYLANRWNQLIPIANKNLF